MADHEPKRYEMKGYPHCDRCGDALTTREEQEQEMCEACFKLWKAEEITIPCTGNYFTRR